MELKLKVSTDLCIIYICASLSEYIESNVDTDKQVKTQTQPLDRFLFSHTASQIYM